MDFVFNDGGRAAAGRGRFLQGDCVCRSICIATGLPYREVSARLSKGMNTERPRRTRWGMTHKTSDRERASGGGVLTETRWFRRYMGTLGFVRVDCRMTAGKIGKGKAVHLNDLPMGTIIAAVKNHYACVRDGVLHDTHRSNTDGDRLVREYWKRPGDTDAIPIWEGKR